MVDTPFINLRIAGKSKKSNRKEGSQNLNLRNLQRTRKVWPSESYDVLCRPPPWYNVFEQIFYMLIALLTFFIAIFLEPVSIFYQLLSVLTIYVFH
jgi:hypothetical protein